jgi:hypothetical protein
MFKHTVGTSYSTDAGTVINIPETITGSTSRDIDAVIGPGASAQYDVAIQPSLVQSMLMASDQPVAIVSGSDTINLKQNVPLVWTLNSWWPIPLTAPVTQLEITNNGPQDASVKIRVLAN